MRDDASASGPMWLWLLLVVVPWTWGTPSAGCAAGGHVPPDGAVYHPGDWVDASANGVANASAQYWGQGLAGLAGDCTAQNVCTLWPTLTGSAAFDASISTTAQGAAFTSCQCELWAESHCFAAKTVEWEDIGNHTCACYGNADAIAVDPEGESDPPAAEWIDVSWFTVEDWGPPGPPPGGGEGGDLGGVIAESERS